MYFSIEFIGIVAIILLLGIVLGICRQKYAFQKVASMSIGEKSELLDSLLTPLGYSYNRQQDIISSRNDAWQREFGYTALFDDAAPHFNMVFDWLPIYFYYEGKTWLIELWKGQYGINTGAEVGIYYCDHILSEEERQRAHFQVVKDTDMLPISFSLTKKGFLLAAVSKRTWLLTAFSMGLFSQPMNLALEVGFLFPNKAMLNSFLLGLHECGFPDREIKICDLQLMLKYTTTPPNTIPWYRALSRRRAQFFNKLFCKLYLFITRYFCMTVDRLLYLYYLLPVCFRCTLRLHRYQKNKRH